MMYEQPVYCVTRTLTETFDKIKFVFSKKAPKLTFIAYCQIDGEDFVNFCSLPRKHEI